MNKGQGNPRYKTVLCKKFMSTQSCPYGEKCQFAHGEQELRPFNGQAPNMMYTMGMGSKNQNNMLNYKIVKCKNWEKDKTCKYGVHCTYAHGEEELRNKADNLYQMNPSPYPFMMPIIASPDMAQMQQLMQNNQFILPIQMNQMNQMNMNNKNEEIPQNQNNEKNE